MLTADLTDYQLTGPSLIDWAITDLPDLEDEVADHVDRLTDWCANDWFINWLGHHWLPGHHW
jgi:hypothetical protein